MPHLPWDFGFGPVYGALLWAALIVVSDCDLLLRKVPNLLNLAIGLLGFCAQWAVGRAEGLATGALGLGAAFCLVLIPFAMRLYRGGDAKFILALGIWLGPWSTLWMFLLGVVLGGLLGLGMWIWSRWQGAVKSERTSDVTSPPSQTPSLRRMVPMAIAFSMGAACLVVWPA